MAVFAQYFGQELLDNVRADVTLVIRRIEGPDDGAAAPKPKRARRAAPAAPDSVPVYYLQLSSFPAHNFILNTSEYFKVQQGAHWQEAAQPSCSLSTRARSSNGPSSGSSSSSSSAPKRPAVHLTIDSAEQLPAAEAVIAAMYGVPDAISTLEQQEMVYAVVIADMVNVAAAGQQAVQALQAAAKSEQGLAAATLALALLPQWPACMLQLLPSIIEHAPCCRDSRAELAAVAAADAGGRIQRLLVAALGDLQAVWADEQLQALLLGLPLPAMQLLLSSGQLRVPSEDTILYTIKQYVQAQPDGAAKAAAKAALAPLVRAPQLSSFALSCAALPQDRVQQVLGPYAQQLRDLLRLKLIASEQEVAAALQTFEGAPASWREGPRQIQLLGDGVRLQWRLPVEQLQQACRDSFAQHESVNISSPSSPPFGGVAWSMKVLCFYQNGGTGVALFVGPAATEVPASIYYRLRCSVSCQGMTRTYRELLSRHRPILWTQTFSLPPMAGDGWDAAAWAAAGLPAAGDTLLELCVHSVE